MDNISREERSLVMSTVTLANMTQICTNALSNISHIVPKKVDGVEYNYATLAKLITCGIMSKLEEKRNVK